MPRSHRPADDARRQRDDFSRIKGIGPALAQRLWDAGIRSFHDLAEASPEEIAEVLNDATGMSPERITRLDWAGQARQLAGSRAETSDPGQRYASFNLQFLLEPDNSIRRTKLHHLQMGTEDTWPGWDQDRLISCLRERIPFQADIPATGSGDLPPTLPAAPARSQALTATLPPTLLTIEELAPIQGDQISFVQRHDEPISVRLTLRIKPADLPLAATYDCTTTVVARKLGGDDRWPIGTAHGVIRTNESVSFDLTGPPAPPGLYRLTATMAIYTVGHSPEDLPLHSRNANGKLMHANAPVEGAQLDQITQSAS
jgi:hypothetical protein